jgi:hypothetical protein
MPVKKYQSKFFLKEELEISDKEIENINFEPLEKEIKSFCGVKPKFKVKKITRKSSQIYVTLEDPKNYASEAGILAKLYKHLEIGTFNSVISKKENEDALFWWMSLAFGYEYAKGGSNATTFLTAWYDFETDKWEFREEGK